MRNILAEEIPQTAGQINRVGQYPRAISHATAPINFSQCVHSGMNQDAGPAIQFRLQNCTRTRLVLESRCRRIEYLIPYDQNRRQNQTASKTVPELATHWHSRGPQSKLHASSAVLGWGLATTGGIGLANTHLQYFTVISCHGTFSPANFSQALLGWHLLTCNNVPADFQWHLLTCNILPADLRWHLLRP